MEKRFVGTSGWQYDHWKKRFYPDDAPKGSWLKIYGKHFNSVEVNRTFYGPVSRATFRKWHDSAPAGFRFSLKGSRWITHMKKLSGVEKEVRKFYRRAEPLKRKLGCVLWQLPPMLKKDIGRLSGFCNMLDRRRNNAIEFRDKSWFDREVWQLLGEKGVAFCSISAPGLPDDVKCTSGVAYARFHGKSRWYSGLYPEKEIKKWAKRIKMAKPESIYCYFNNDAMAYAVRNAEMMAEMLGS